jgi:dTDP-4-dehydrorhamnose 3,5-epimerase
VEALPTEVDGCRELRLDPMADRRGSFLKLFQSSRFEAAGLSLDVREVFVSRSALGVVRGLHFQAPPADVAKLVCCLDGSVLDAVVDLRVDSPTFRRHCVVALSPEHANAVYVPHGCAHGFVATSSDALVLYAQSGEHDPVREGGILWSSAGIDWPLALTDAVLSDRDAEFPTLADFDSPFHLVPGAAPTHGSGS